MSKLSAVLRKTAGGYAHWCPGCEEMHHIAVERPLPNRAQWTFDGNAEKPTFHPSVNIATAADVDLPFERCHYFLVAGELRYLGDSTHALAGRTVPLPPLPE